MSPAATQAFWEQPLEQCLADLSAAQLRRVRRAVRRLDATHVEIEGEVCVNFASNDYLGLSHHPEVIAAAQRVLGSEGVGSGASALVTGYTPHHAAAEAALAQWKQTEDAVLLPSGYQANYAAVQALAALGDRSGGVRFLVDHLAHASLIDAVLASGQPFRVFPHNTLSKLERLLKQADPGPVQVVVTESIFSMDGDAADLAGLAALKRRRPFVLLLDEAHASGVYGPDGAGYAAEQNLHDLPDLSVVTLSKGLGCMGGAVCAARRWCEMVVNHGRAFIFSTSLPAALAAAVEAAIAVMRREPQRRTRLRQLALQVRQAAVQMGFKVPPGDAPIVPIILGDPSAALAAAEKFRRAGMLLPAIRPPTVPRGSARLRITLNAAHTDAEIHKLIHGLQGLPQTIPSPRAASPAIP